MRLLFRYVGNQGRKPMEHLTYHCPIEPLIPLSKSGELHINKRSARARLDMHARAGYTP
jgi:hypothetical protein